MQARYAGKCHKCGEAIAVGMPITWNRAIRGSTSHVDCADVWGRLTVHPLDVTVTPASASIGEKIDAMDAHVIAESAVTRPSAHDGRIVTKHAVGDCIDCGCDADSGHKIGCKFSNAPVSTPVEYRKAKPTTETTKPIASNALSNLSQNAAWYDVLASILPHVTRILLVGPPATGKSTTAMKVANCKYRVTMTETTSREDLIGMFHLIDGATKWIDGPITSAMRNGETVLVDEIDRYSPEAASLLYALIDDKPHLSLPNGDMLYAANGYKMIMTSNEGLDTLPVAVQDRIEVILSAHEPHADAISDLPQAMQNVTVCYYRSIPKTSIKLPTTVRRMRTLHHLLSNGLAPKLAATIVFGQSAEVLSVIASAENAVASS